MSEKHPRDGWVSSSHSDPNGGQCVQWHPAQALATGTVPIRDSKRPTGEVIAFGAAAWTAFVEHAGR
ncbi:DUF397 domain-containing protein [Streptomyces sp. BI20]|uniref:DUF397 domain-containing protein n=1 Tax=Streptomyces sp. BI20 TaxID=3403460 RepID=UPI003C790984